MMIEWATDTKVKNIAISTGLAFSWNARIRAPAMILPVIATPKIKFSIIRAWNSTCLVTTSKPCGFAAAFGLGGAVVVDTTIRAIKARAEQMPFARAQFAAPNNPPTIEPHMSDKLILILQMPMFFATISECPFPLSMIQEMLGTSGVKSPASTRQVINS